MKAMSPSPQSVGLWCLLALGVGCEATDPAWIQIFQAPDSAAVYELFETAGWLGVAVDNPFDPEQVDLVGEFRDPDERIHEIPGFWYQGYRRELDGDTERLTPVGDGHFRVRFMPDRPGTWRYRWRVSAGERRGATAWRELRVEPPRGGTHGPLRQSPHDTRYLAYADGAPFFAIGSNMAWTGSGGSYDYDRWLAALAGQGGNYVRLWMPSWGFGLEWLERDAEGRIVTSSLGDYRTRLSRAWQLDTVLERARTLGVQVMLCLQNHGPFSSVSFSEWDDNPYNAANGGPIAAPGDFFTDPAARALFARRLRYLVARYGYASNLLAWELFNEVDLTAFRDKAEVVAWHAEMAALLKSLDPVGHLVTTSTANLGALYGLDPELYALSDIDLAQFHLYGYEGNDVDFTVEMPRVAGTYRAFGKPVLAGEVGVDYRGPAETLARDPHSAGYHDSLWMGLFSETLGTGASWWWDSLAQSQEWYRHLYPISRLLDGLSLDRARWVALKPQASAPGRDLEAFALFGDGLALIWVRNRANLWFSGHDESPVEGASIALTGLGDGVYSARAVDPYDGSLRALPDVTVDGGTAGLVLPTFSMDLGLRLERR